MAQFRKKPVVIEAWQFNGEDRYAWPDWVNGLPSTAYRLGDVGGPEVLTIDTLEGQMTASKGDWIIRGVKGELYPIKHEIFLETYEAVDAA